jgi:OOP family OmpA-OmpF porin
MLADEAREDVGGATGREGNHEAHLLCWPWLAMRERCSKESAENEGSYHGGYSRGDTQVDRRAVAGAVLIVGALASTAAQAQSSPEGGWYAGASIGGAAVRFGEDFLRHPASTGAETFTKDEEARAFKAYVGKRIARHFAVEGGYAQFGSFTASRTFASLALFGPGALDYKLQARGFFLDGVGILPVGDALNLFAKAGLVYAMSKASVRESGSVTATVPRFRGASETEITPKLGVGASLQITQRVDVRFEMEQVLAVGDENSTGEGDIRMVSMGLAYRF